MEFVRAETAALGAEDVVIIENDFAITEMKSPRREACLGGEDRPSRAVCRRRRRGLFPEPYNRIRQRLSGSLGR